MFSSIKTLTTKALSLTEEHAEKIITPVIYPSRSSSKQYYVDVFVGNERVGSMTFNVVKAGTSESHLYIVNMDNLKPDNYKHIGNALHEIAFRCSEEIQAQLGIKFNAAYNSHYFHLKNGFITDFFDLAYYLLLAKLIINTPNDNKILTAGSIASRNVYMPKSTAEEKRKQFGLPPRDTEVEESDQNRTNILKIIAEAEQRTIAIKTMIGLHSKIACNIINELINEITGSKKLGIKDSIKLQAKLAQTHPGLFCVTTSNILNESIDSIINLIPLDTLKKQQKFDETVVGAIILICAYQDKQYGKQIHFQNRLLNPHQTFDEIFSTLNIEPDTANDIEIIEIIGKAALIEHKIPWDNKIPAEVFSGFINIAELEARFSKYKPIAKVTEYMSENKMLSREKEFKDEYKLSTNVNAVVTPGISNFNLKKERPLLSGIISPMPVKQEAALPQLSGNKEYVKAHQ